VEQPSYFPDLAPNDFWMFRKIKSALRGQRLQDTEDMQQNVTMTPRAIPQQEFQNVSNSGNIVGLSAQLLKGSTWKVTPLSEL
jgi:hypothetical protein